MLIMLSELTFSKKLTQEYYKGFKRFGSEYKILANVISRRQSMSPEGKGLTLLFGIFLFAPWFCFVKVFAGRIYFVQIRVNILNGSSS